MLVVCVTDMSDREQVKALLSDGVGCVCVIYMSDREQVKALLSDSVDCVCYRHVRQGTGEGLGVGTKGVDSYRSPP